MKQDEIKELLDAGQSGQVEALWNQAAQAGAAVEELAAALELLVAAGQTDLAEMLGWTLLDQRAGKLPAPEALEAAKRFLLAVPDSQELRQLAAELYQKTFARQEHFEAMLSVSGLLGGQSARRAFRTLDVCLAVRPGSYLANRFEPCVLRVEKFNPATGVFEAVDQAGVAQFLDPVSVGGEYNLIDRADFRVLCLHHPQELKDLLEKDPAAVLTGMCLAHGGSIDAGQLKDALVGRYLAADQWSGWWNRARTAARRCPQLSLEGRSPVIVSYHPAGRTLEEELAPVVEQARMPLDRLIVLRQYARQVKERKGRVKDEFAGAIVEALAEQVRHFQAERPSDALAAALAIEAAVELGMPAPKTFYPTARDILSATAQPAAAMVALEDSPLWTAALEALTVRSDSPAVLRELLYRVDSSRLDSLRERLAAPEDEHAVAEAMAKALANPAGNLELFLWLYKGPVRPLPALPGKSDLFSRLLGMLQEIDHDWNVDSELRKAVRHRVRSAIAAADYAAFRQAVAEMDQAVAGTLKGRIERCVGLAQAVQEDLLAILREGFYALFAKARLAPWEDESTLWTTAAAYEQRTKALKELTEVKMLENARAIGAAAEHGDLSENSEWKFALEERDLLRARAAKMQQELSVARVLHPGDAPTDHVGVGSRVLLRRTADGRELELSFLGPWDGDPDRNIYYYRAAMALELMGKTIGDVVQLKLEGREGEYHIEKHGSAI